MDHLDLIKDELADTGEIDSGDKIELAAELVTLAKSILNSAIDDKDTSGEVLHALEIIHLLSKGVEVADIERHDLPSTEPAHEDIAIPLQYAVIPFDALKDEPLGHLRTIQEDTTLHTYESIHEAVAFAKSLDHDTAIADCNYEDYTFKIVRIIED